MLPRLQQISLTFNKALNVTKNIYTKTYMENIEDFYELYFSLLNCSNVLFTHHLSRVCEKVSWSSYFKFFVLMGGHSFF